MSIVKSFSVGNGDMFYIDHNSDNFTTIDCCYNDEDEKKEMFDEIKVASEYKGITRFISTHPDNDHIKGLNNFCTTVGIVNFYCVENEATKSIETDDFNKYCELRDGDKHFYLYKGCSRRWMNLNSEERKCSGINCLWPLISNEEYKAELENVKEGKSPNNISPIITYSLEDGITAMWMGDMEHVFLEKVKDKINFSKIDILFAPHHGRETGKVSSDVLEKLDPGIIIIGEAPSENLNYYSGYNTITQNSAGDIIFECISHKVHIYVSSSSYSVNFLDDEQKSNTYGYYIGTLAV